MIIATIGFETENCGILGGVDFKFDNVLDDEFHIFTQICLANGYDVVISQLEKD